MKYVLTPAVLCTMLACSTEPDTMGALPSSPMPSDDVQQLAAGGPAPAGTGGQGGTGGSPSIAGRAGSAGHAGSRSVPKSAGTGGLGGSSGASAAGTGSLGGAGGGGASGLSGTAGSATVDPVPDWHEPFCKLDKPVDNYGDFWGCDMLDGWKPTTTAHSMIVWWIEFDTYGTPVRETSQGCQSNYYKEHVPCPVGMPCQLVLTYGPGVGTQLKYDGTCQ